MEPHQINDLLVIVDEEITNIQAATASNPDAAIGRALNNIKAVIDTLVENVKTNKTTEKKGNHVHD